MTAHREVRQFLREVISPGSDAAIRRARSDLRRLVEGKPSTHISGGARG